MGHPHKTSMMGWRRIPGIFWGILVLFSALGLENVAHARGIHQRDGFRFRYHAKTRSSEETNRRRLKHVNVTVPESPDDHLVTSLPLLDYEEFTTEHWAGLLPASAEGDKFLFYWLFAPDFGANVTEQVADDDVPLLIWLNGGPACSSMDGLWLENGPLRLRYENGKWKVEPAEHSWNKAPAYTLYLDQPVGTGLSFTTGKNYPRNDLEVNVDVYYFLQRFMKLHADKMLDSSELRMRRSFFWAGESHAGHYIPSMMNYIRKQNTANPKRGIVMPLSGAAIGNGYFSPMYQYSAHEAAFGHGLIDMAQRLKLAEEEKKCQRKLQQSYASSSGQYAFHECRNLYDMAVSAVGYKYEVSSYDVRKWEREGVPRDYPKGHKVVEAYLGGLSMPEDEPAPFSDKDLTAKVLKAIHSEASTEAGQQYQECTDPPYEALSHQEGLGVEQDVIDLLEHGNGDDGGGIRMLFFNGVEDLICNHAGNEVALENLNWSGKDGWIVARRYGWRSTLAAERGVIGLSGYMKEHGNLLFLKVLGSGHMVPMDVPDVALDMMRTFAHNGSFDMYRQPVAGSLEKASTCPKAESCPVCPSVPPVDGNTTEQKIACPTGKSSQHSPPADSGGVSPATVLAQPLSAKAAAGYVLAGVLFVMLLINFFIQRKTKSVLIHEQNVEMQSMLSSIPEGDDDEDGEDYGE